ncbi:MAG: M1 family aminopeptidase, partial [Chloroflexus sp.]
EQANAELNAFRTVYRRLRDRGGDAPLATPPSGLSDGRYVPVVYAKGALFFHALRQHVGEDAFNDFLQRYVTTASYREIAGHDLLRAAEQACLCELGDLFEDWVMTVQEVTIP